MSQEANSEFAALRRIGWDYWDPIGIGGFSADNWRVSAADEYDRYIQHVAWLLKGGAPVDHAIAYLDRIASDHMGLGPITAKGHAASVQTVTAVAEYLRR